MDTFKERDLTKLLKAKDKYCISFYLPTHRTGREQQQDTIRFGNLVSKAQAMLLELGIRQPTAQKLLQPAEAMLADKDFWQHQSDGLAVFLSEGFFQSYRLPHRFDELMMIGKSFHIKPLLPQLNENGQFYILALSLNEIRLFESTRYTVTELELPNMPKNMEEALSTDDPEKHLDFHTGTRNPTPGTTSNRPAVHHGQGVQSEEENKKNILRYFQAVNDELKKALTDYDTPLIVACVDYLFPIYQEANKYPGLLKEKLAGNPEKSSPDELRQRGWDLVEPVFGENQRKAMQQFKQLYKQQSNLASGDLKTIVSAARFGMVDTLFTSLGVQRWGTYDAGDNRIQFNEGPDGNNEDLLNYAARQTLLNSGQVFALPADELPVKDDIAAILRYAN